MGAPNTCVRGKQRRESKPFHDGRRNAEHITRANAHVLVAGQAGAAFAFARCRISELMVIPARAFMMVRQCHDGAIPATSLFLND
jgi:hypothetical protein